MEGSAMSAKNTTSQTPGGIRPARSESVPRNSLSVAEKRDVRQAAERAKVQAELQLWLSREHLPKMTRPDMLRALFAEQICLERVERIISLIDQNQLGLLSLLLEDLCLAEHLGLGGQRGVWIGWASSVLSVLGLPEPQLPTSCEPLVIGRTCEQCQKQFVPQKKHNQFGALRTPMRYCGDACRRLGEARPPVECGWCRKMFRITRGRTRYCSTDCQKARQNALRLENDRQRRREKAPVRNCKECGRDIPLRRHRSQYCSQVCAGTFD